MSNVLYVADSTAKSSLIFLVLEINRFLDVKLICTVANLATLVLHLGTFPTKIGIGRSAFLEICDQVENWYRFIHS